MIELSAVSGALVAVSRACLQQVTGMLAEPFPEASVEPLGSSFVEGSLSKGDVDLLVSVSPERFSLLSEYLLARGEAAQAENWSPVFASFSLDLDCARSVGVQLIRGDSAELGRLRAQSRALADPATRHRYDVAKRHGRRLDPMGYWEVKNAFWATWQGGGPQWSAARRPVLKILRRDEWQVLLREQESAGAPVDLRDGFVHLSTTEQVAETVERHFAGVEGLWLLTLDADGLGSALRWETSRGGALFPHLYGPLRLADVCLVRPWAASSPPGS